MRYLFASFVLVAVGLLAVSARADEEDKKDVKKADDGPRVEWREKVIKEFDKDGDGKLSDEEREKARETMRELHGRMGSGLGRGGPGGPGRPRGPQGRRGPDGKGPDGPPKLPKPEELFAKFDQDKDDKLSKDEFKKLAEYVHEHMPPPPPPAGPRGGRFEGRFEGHLEGRFIEGGPGGPGPRFRDGEDSGDRFRGPGGPPPGPPFNDEGPGEFRRRPGGPPPGDGPRLRGPRFDRDDRRGPPDGRDGSDEKGDEDEEGHDDGKEEVKSAV